MTGDDFLQRVEERRPDTVRVMLAGCGQVGNGVDNAGESDIFYCSLFKSCGDQELQNTIRHCLQRGEVLAHGRLMTGPEQLPR